MCNVVSSWEDIVPIVNKVLFKYCDEFRPTEQSVKTAFCELGSDLWNKSLLTVINDLSNKKFPTLLIMKEFMNYLMKADSDGDISLLEELFFKLVLFNPPTNAMFDYYKLILSKPYIMDLHGEVINLTTKSKSIAKKRYFEDLDWSDKFNKCLIALNFTYNVFETEFSYWLSSEEHKFYNSKKKRRSLISHMLWPEDENLDQELIYPYLGIKSNEFAKELAINFYDGKTFLHLACEINNVEEIKSLLTFPELDLNAIDRNGWTALHIACRLGNSNCVHEIINFIPLNENQKSVDVRAKGPEGLTPIMCAVKENKPEICHQLLERFGSVLLDDVNDLDVTPGEMTNDEEILRILKYYENENHVEDFSLFNKKIMMIIIKEEYGELGFQLCLEMIRSYLYIYRLRDIYKSYKKFKENSSHDNDNFTDLNVYPHWDYKRINRDVNKNLDNLKELIVKLSPVTEIQSSLKIISTILSFY
ncbi:ankyrin repeat domain-containing protein, putative [Pediculus humanus corporis]|uniref:Ankyrin repeat domain-containing protein, putative n=1 Tax=Pediculus humanus subsp. corporis TaxID=121224 RepID=E0VH68_PEDHC|nr:ankyrin repeat domain-containing protein, putative [Pediculus humanus corporis]EEB12724.1 ankyrin repeat domain-containing protein, putative [Pediculus humanus corporis]